MGPQPLPGIQARYSFFPMDGAAGLRVVLSFDPTRADPLLDDPAGLPKDGTPAPRLVTALATEPLTVTADGAGLRERIATFVATIRAHLDEGSAAPASLDLEFRLAANEAAALPNDLFELRVQIDLADESDGLASPILASPSLPPAPGEGSSAPLADFAAAFERAWDRDDGAGPLLKLAAAPGADPPSLWCVRTPAAEGLAIEKAGSAETVYRAVPPLAAVLLGGTVADPAGGSQRFSSIDLDRWWDRFADEMERAAAPDLAGAIGSASSGSAERLAAVRAAIAQALAQRLAPIAASSAASASDSARTAFEESARARPARRVTLGETAVKVRMRGAEAEPMLFGAVDRRPAAVRLQGGGQILAWVAPASDAPRIEFPARFEGTGFIPAGSPRLELLLPAGAFSLDLGPQTAPAPLIAAPGVPSLAARSTATGADAAGVAEALAWSVETELVLTHARHDRLELDLSFDPSAAFPAPAEETASGALFDALARFNLFASAAPLDPGALEQAAVERFVALAEDVAEALPGWRSPAASPPPAPGPGWRYVIDFAEWPALLVTRHARGSQEAPPWPSIAGFAAPRLDGPVARYEAESETSPGDRLVISIAAPAVPTARTARVAARIRRNGGLAGVDAVNPCFVYEGALASSGAVVPRLDWRSAEPQAAPTLGAALEPLLDPLGDGGPGYLLTVKAELVQGLADGGAGDRLEQRVPILLARDTIGTGEGEVRLADFRTRLAAGLAAGTALLDPSSDRAEVELMVEVREPGGGSDPLARLRCRIAVPPERPEWWGAPEAKA